MIAGAKEIIKKPDLITQMVMLLHYIRYSSIRKQNVLEIIKTLFETIKSSLPPEIVEHFKSIVMSLSGYNEDKEPASQSQRLTEFLKVFINMSVPVLKDKLDLLDLLLEFGSVVLKAGANKELMAKALPQITDDLSTLMGLNQKLLKSIFGIMQADIKSLSNFVAPICKISPQTLKQILKIFDQGKSALDYVMKAKTTTERKIDEVERSNYLLLMKKVNDGSAGARELFQLIDLEGDKSGGISITEFMRLMQKLNMPMTEHRVHEVFSHCKSKYSKNPDELDEQGN